MSSQDNQPSSQKFIANSKFYNDHNPNDKNLSPEQNFLNAFFNTTDLYKSEVLEPEALESTLQILKLIYYSIIYLFLFSRIFNSYI